MTEATNILQASIFIIVIGGIITGLIGNYVQSYTIDNVAGNTAIFIGNVLSLFGLIALIPIIISFKYQQAPTVVNSVFQDFIVTPFPSILTIVVIAYNTYLNLVYKDELIYHRVSAEYYWYALLFFMLLILQIILLGKYIKDYLESSVAIDSPYQYGVYLFATLNIVLLSIMRIILKYFSTDG